MRSFLAPHVTRLIERVSRKSQPLSWFIYVVGVALSLVMWNPPLASRLRLDVNDLSPGTAAARIRLSRQDLADVILTSERIILSQRTDGSQKLLLCVPQMGSNGRRNALAVDIGRAMSRMDPAYLSKDLIISFPGNMSQAQEAIDVHLRKYSQCTIAALILEEAELPAGYDIELDALGPTRPNLDLLASTIRNCQYLGLQCRLRPDVEGSAAALHWSLNKRRVDAMTIRLGKVGRTRREAVCALVETELRSLNNLNEHLHDSSFMYLISPKGYEEPLVLYPPQMTAVMAPFPLAMVIGSLKEEVSEIGFFYQALVLSVCSHAIAGAIAALHPLIQTLITCLVLDLGIVGRWPLSMRCQICQQAALHLVVLAVIDYLEALRASLWLVPFVLSLFCEQQWLLAAGALIPVAAMWCDHSGGMTTLAPVVSMALVWLVRS